MVPKASSPRAARSRAPGIVSSSHFTLVPEKYGSSSSPVFAVTLASWPADFSCAQISAVRRSCQTSALWIGTPVARSQITVVSRWLVRPSAATGPACAKASRTVESTVAQIASGSCSTQPGAGNICGNSRCAVATGRRPASKTIARVEVVP